MNKQFLIFLTIIFCFYPQTIFCEIKTLIWTDREENVTYITIDYAKQESSLVIGKRILQTHSDIPSIKTTHHIRTLARMIPGVIVVVDWYRPINPSTFELDDFFLALLVKIPNTDPTLLIYYLTYPEATLIACDRRPSCPHVNKYDKNIIKKRMLRLVEDWQYDQERAEIDVHLTDMYGPKETEQIQK